MLKYLILIAIIHSICVLSTAKTTTHATTKKNSISSTTQSKSAHSYTVVKVADGDTITVLNNTSKEQVRIRFLCIDAPEKSQGKWGADSLKKIAEMLPLKSEVQLIGQKTDLYGRTVAEVINQNGVNVNKKMTEIGYVVHYPFQKGCNDYEELEKHAKSKKLGVWSDPTFELPWKYRERMCIGLRCNHKSSDSSTLSAGTSASKSTSSKQHSTTSTTKSTRPSRSAKTTTTKSTTTKLVTTKSTTTKSTKTASKHVSSSSSTSSKH